MRFGVDSMLWGFSLKRAEKLFFGLGIGPSGHSELIET